VPIRYITSKISVCYNLGVLLKDFIEYVDLFKLIERKVTFKVELVGFLVIHNHCPVTEII